MSAELSATHPGLWRAYQVAFSVTVGAAVLLGLVWLAQLAGMASGMAGLQGVLLGLVMIGGVCMGLTYGALALRRRR